MNSDIPFALLELPRGYVVRRIYLARVPLSIPSNSNTNSRLQFDTRWLGLTSLLIGSDFPSV